MKGGRMQAKDIPDMDFIRAVLTVGIIRRSRMTMRWDVQAMLAGYPVDWPREDREDIERKIPAKVVMAKAARLINRGWLDGCSCGCRGDYEVMPRVAEGLGMIADVSDGRTGMHEPYGFWVWPA